MRTHAARLALSAAAVAVVTAAIYGLDQVAPVLSLGGLYLFAVLPVAVVEAPFRDVGKPLLSYLRQITAEPDAVAVAVMPELVARGTDRLLHNQRALYLKRLLLFEERVILTSVPFQLTEGC
jgi:hypothetical protein